ncbi:hypothetical protein BTJ39_03520 [Izhakiella australiensis]|uniref:Cytoplasmic protein n=1 Tax=Izhakiella australiensis TaxID=1926881 RepID=A0A1S8YPI0_9GAMM|nr:DUF1869 domain-containing protein [Izhakiella australiensis]OON41051.1 hypothetical protein BTJ39_03520 [Izhakiella australiensis]
MTNENAGYSLAIVSGNNGEKREKRYLKPMSLYVPAVAAQEVAGLLNQLSEAGRDGDAFMLTVTNNNNGVSVDMDFSSLTALQEPTIAADAVKELINIVRGYESDEETNVCGW